MVCDCSYVYLTVWIGAKLPLYAFKKVDRIVAGEKTALEHETTEPPVAFLDSLLLGEV